MMQKTGKILIVDDNQDVLNALEVLLDDEFERVKTIRNPNIIPSALTAEMFDVVLLDMNFKASQNTGNEGIFWLDKIQASDAGIVVILLTAYGGVDLAVKAMKLGATDFILKPWDNDKLITTLKSAVKLSKTHRENQSLKMQNAALVNELKSSSDLFVGRSAIFKKIKTTVRKIAPTEASILITGANGTGKTMMAREIHRLSACSNGPFISVDLGAITESLFESEMFGHKKGAFTDAKTDHLGKIEAAHQGTLFLDEIGNLSAAMQAKLLTALQDQTIVPLGSNTPKKVNIRIISATNRNPEELIQKNQFRVDLFYRINTITLNIPPLAARREDIRALAQYFFEKYIRKYQKPGLKANEKFFTKLEEHKWPGNVRELGHAIEKAVILAEGQSLSERDFSYGFSSVSPQDEQPKTMEEIEKLAILNVLEKHKGNQVRAAKELNITRQTIYNKIKKYDL